jgi:diguanylate cyclase (GGDEF)-like protein
MTLDVLLAAAGGGLGGWVAHTAVFRRRLGEGRRDPVTGLATRADWSRLARKILRRGSHLVVLIDLDWFKEINDSYGHPAGDHVLAVTASRLLSWAEQAGGGACGRLGGDEFVFVSRRLVVGPEVGRLVTALCTPVTLPGGQPVPVSASVGAARTASRDPSPALAGADAAMYAAKQDGGGCWRLAGSLPQPVASPGRHARSHRLAG